MGRPKLYDGELKFAVTNEQREAVEREAKRQVVPPSQVLRDLINKNLLGINK